VLPLQEDKMNHHVVTIDGFEDVPQYDEVALKKAASQQPVAVAIEADQRAFQLYVGGVFDDEDCGEELDHGVLVSQWSWWVWACVCSCGWWCMGER
jgi:hypothetical protein